MGSPNSTATGSTTAGLPLALGERVPVRVADDPAVALPLGLPVTVGEPGGALGGERVAERVRAGVRDTDVEGVPVAVLEGVPEAEAVLERVRLAVGLVAPLPDGAGGDETAPEEVAVAVATGTRTEPLTLGAPARLELRVTDPA